MGSAAENPSALPLHERVYRYLSDALMQGKFVPGQRLTLRALAEDLGMSMSPIREAVSRLAALRAVQIFPKRYILVTPLSAELYMDMVELRKLLEGHAAARACARMTESDIERVAEINTRLLYFARDGQMRKSMQENHAFHFTVYRSSGSQVLLENIEHIWLRIGPSLNQLLAKEYARDDATLAKGFDYHDKLIAALRQRDVNGALSAIIGDISMSTHYLLEGLRRQSNSSNETLQKLRAAAQE